MVAETILHQLGGSGKLKAMIGAKQFTAGANNLTFRFTAPSLNKANCIRITLNAMDTYDVEFIRVRKFDLATIHTESGIYAEDLRRIIEQVTGLYLSLGTLGRERHG